MRRRIEHGHGAVQVVGAVQGRPLTVPWQVEGDGAVLGRERFELPLPHGPVEREAVDKDHWVTGATVVVGEYGLGGHLAREDQTM